MSESGTAIQITCACGKKILIPTNAIQHSKKRECPICGAIFENTDGTWLCANSQFANGDGLAYREHIERNENELLHEEAGPATAFLSRVKSSHSHERTGECGNADTGSRALRHESIRSSIIGCLHLAREYGSEVADAIALACHPWPDQDISPRLRDVIAAEMLPVFNINHPSIQEIAADRLLRIAEAVALENGPQQLQLNFTRSANILAAAKFTTRSADALTHKASCDQVVSSPWGFSRLADNANERNLNLVKIAAVDSFDDNQWSSVIYELIGCSGKHRSRDIGLICGEKPLGITIDQLASRLEVELPEVAFDHFLKSLSSRRLDILTSRTLKLQNPDTLMEVASRWSITRERVRQIETKLMDSLRNKFADRFNAIGDHLLSPFQSRLAKISDHHGIALALAEKSQYQSELAAFILHLFGPWNTDGEWVMHCSIADDVSRLREKLTDEADQYGFLNHERIEHISEKLFFNAADRNLYLTDVLELGFSFGNWMHKQTLRCEVASALKKIGRPATKEEIADLLGHPAQSVGSLLGNLDGVVRADRYRWGFSEWIDDVYDGILGEIEQRIDAYSGAVPVHILLTEIPSQFGVAEGSVRSYLACPAFVVENNMVRRANSDEYVPRSPETCEDAVRVGDCWAQKTRIHDRHFKGYSLGVNFDIAFANGLRPRDDLVVPINGCDYEVSLIWRLQNLNRLVDVGRISAYLKSEGYQPGDSILILPTRESVMLIRENELEERYLETKKSGVDAEDHDEVIIISDPLLDLLGEA